MHPLNLSLVLSVVFLRLSCSCAWHWVLGAFLSVQRFSELNQMNLHNLAIVFGPTLFQTDGKDYTAGLVIEGLIEHYTRIFEVRLAAHVVCNTAENIPNVCLHVKCKDLF